MPLDLTQFKNNQASKLEFSMAMATRFIDVMEKRTCCDSCEVHTENTYSMPERPLTMICDMVGSMLFSSGYFSDYELKKKGKDGIRVRFTICKMSDEDKIKCGLHNDTTN